MTRYTITNCSSSHSGLWDRFVEDSINGTVFHRQDFLSYHPRDRFVRDDKIIFKADRPVAVFPLSISNKEGKKTGRSPYGGSFGGLVTGKMSTSKLKEIIQALFHTLEEEGYEEIEVCFPPLPYYKGFDGNLEYMFLKSARASLVDRGLTSVVRLDCPKNYSQNYSRNIKKAAAAGVEVRMSEDVDTFYGILENVMRDKHGTQPTHTLAELHRLKQILGEMLKIFLGYRKDMAISGVLVFENSSPCALAFYNGHLQQYSEIPSLHYVFDHVIDHYSTRKKYLDLGLTDLFSSSFNNGLFQFKEGMGAAGYYRDYYRISLRSKK